MICISDLYINKYIPCFNQHSLYVCASVIDNHVWFCLFCFQLALFIFSPFFSFFFLLMDYNCQLILNGMSPEENHIWGWTEVEWISVKCTLPTATLIYGKIDMGMDGRKEGKKLNLKKKKEKKMCSFFPLCVSSAMCLREICLDIFILQAVCLKGKLKR